MDEPPKNKLLLDVLPTKKIHIFDASGKPRYLLGISEDITERKLFGARSKNAPPEM